MAKNTIDNAIINDYKKHQGSFVDFAGNITQLLKKNLLFEYKDNIHSIDPRVKTLESLESKLIRKNNKYRELCEITDIVGIRIITYYEDSVDLIASIIENEFDVDKENTIDKRIAIDPDKFGYLSLHYIVSVKSNRNNLPEYRVFDNFKFEIQIRSILQHTWAEIEHDLGYKSKVGIPRDVQRDFSRLAGLLELADKEFIGIRDKLKKYRKSVSKDMESHLSDFLVDNVSVAVYIEKQENIKQLDLSIAIAVNSQLSDECDDIYFTVRNLHAAGLETIKGIDDTIVQNADLCVALAKKLINPGDASYKIPRGRGLFFLCYAVLVRREDVNLLIKYLNDSNIERDYKREALAHKLISIYENYEQESNS